MLGVSAAALAACGASSASSTSAKPMRIVFGLAGGNLPPFQVTIEPTGRVRATGGPRPSRHRLSRAKVVSLSSLVRHDLPGLTSRLCPGTLPDFASEFIHAAGRTVRVRGSCEPRFHRVWNTLARAVGLPSG